MESSVHPRDEKSYDAADPVAVRQRELAAKRKEKSDREVLTSLMSTPAGRDFVWTLLSLCHIYQVSFDPEPTVTAFREGERNIGLWFTQMINRTCPDSMIQMMKERADG